MPHKVKSVNMLFILSRPIKYVTLINIDQKDTALDMCLMKNEAKNNNRQISPTGFNLMRETITYNIYVIYENLLLFLC